MNAPRLHPSEIKRLLADAERLLAQNRIAEAEQAVRRVLATAPNNPLANHYLGAIAFSVGQHEHAINLLRRATELEPGVAPYFASLAEAFSKLGRYDQALPALRRAAELAPNSIVNQHRLGETAGQLGLIEESIAALSRASALKPDSPGVISDLGMSLASARRMDEAIECFRRTGTIDSNYRYDNLIYYSHFADGVDGMAIRAEAEQWAARFAEPLTRAAPPIERDRDPNRRLRIGYVSPDLYEHPVGRFMQPILAHHDRALFEVFVYSGHPVPDQLSAALRASCDQWLDSAGVSDEVLAQRIRDDQIDVLIDLSLHMGHNRLLTFARRPAPVQATYLAYAGTSGMSAMDWRISDSHLDPASNDGFYTERTHRLPRSYWCYHAPPFAEQLGDVRPRVADAPITFACLNNIIKISDAALVAWADILRQVPDSRIIIQGEPGEHLRAMGSFFDRAGVDASRVEFAAKRSLFEYFRLYERIDIALDAFPYAGGTTTCDALWMGVPVVTLAGQIAVQRGGVSILSNLGLPELIASSREQYVATAVELARDEMRFTSLRQELRPRMQASIVMKPVEFVRDLESAFRTLWHEWCAR